MSENNSSPPDIFQSFGESIAASGIRIVRYREFLGNKVARRFMDEVGLVLADDEVGNTALAELLGTVVTSGIVLAMRGTPNQEAIREVVADLSSQLPAELRLFNDLLPHLIEKGINFHHQELTPGTNEIAQWKAEFELLHAANHDPTLWE